MPTTTSPDPELVPGLSTRSEVRGRLSVMLPLFVLAAIVDAMGDGDVIEVPRTKTPPRLEPPKPCRVLLHDNDGIDGFYVMDLLEGQFRLSRSRAVDVVMATHRTGVGLVGVWPCQVAETLVDRAQRKAVQDGWPVLLTTEES